MFDHRGSVREIWKYSSSNINEVIRAVLNFLLLFYEKISHAPKRTKSTKSTKSTTTHNNATKQKPKNANKRRKIKNTLKKHPREKKSLIRLFAFLCLWRNKQKSLYNGNVGSTKLVKVLSALYEQKLVY